MSEHQPGSREAAPDEEQTPHEFYSRTPYEPGDDRDIWCRDCEYHRDHPIHEAALSPPLASSPEQEKGEDYAWAHERVTRLCASALVDAQVYRQKLLKGFGYPNETFRSAQDYRALSIVLDRVASLSTALQQMERERK